MAENQNIRKGFTLVEVLVALVLISGVAIAMGGAAAKLSSTAARDSRVLTAIEVARDRLNRVTSDPAYARLETRYNGTEANVQGFERITTITRVNTPGAGGLTLDYKIVDVVVRGAGLEGAVARRAIVAAP
jgi:prepilin-type N-terminal cleavage/methylation domain-containing protein